MASEKLLRDLRGALDQLRAERDQLNKNISDMEALLATMGSAPKRGPGRPPKNPALALLERAGDEEPPVKRGRGRPKGSKNKTAKEPAPPKVPGKRKKPHWPPEKRAEARARMKAYWAKQKRM
jgi:hypothetical protein